MNNNKLKQLVNKYPNDRELGSATRQMDFDIITIEIDGDVKDINIRKEYPNDGDLGSLIRNIVNNIIS